MKKLNFFLLISIVALFLLYPSFSNAQQSRRKTRTTSAKSKIRSVPIPLNQAASGEKPPAALTENSFSAKGLNNEKLFTNLYRGNFVDIDFDRDDLNFGILYSIYLNSYARSCDAFLPRNKVEMMRKECSVESVTRNGYGMEIERHCVEWVDVGTGLYADPPMYEAKVQLERLQAGDTLRNMLSMMKNPNPFGGATEMAQTAKAAQSDINSLLQTNACSSPGLKRFQENLRLFALNKQPLQLGAKANTTNASSAGGASKDQNYTKLMEDLIAEQSRSWAMNQYERGSAAGVSVTSSDSQGRPAAIRAGYIFNGFSGRSQGSVILTFTDGVPECLYFYDFPNTCRTANRKIAAAYANGNYQK